MRRRQLSGILLTGGSSRRMGFDKAGLLVDGEACAERLARLLSDLAAPVVEVGPGHTGLPAVLESPPGSGPLAAVAAGRSALLLAGHDGPALVLACDLPFVTKALLEVLADHPGDASVVPTVGGVDQPLLARWSARDLDAAAKHLATGERSLRRLPDRAAATRLDEAGWGAVADGRAFADADTPADLAALGLGPG